jgi:hypothetical protein
VVHTCNPTYSGGRDQKNLGSRPAETKIKKLPQKIPNTKKRLVEWLKR